MNVIFNNSGVQGLLDDFQSLVDVKISVFNIERKEIYRSIRTEQTFCNQIRRYESINAGCCECDERAFSYVHKNKDIYIYPCHLGLYEALAPILDEKTIIGYIMVGQIINHSDITTQWERLVKKCKMTGIDINHLKEDFYQLKQLSIKEIKAIANIMHACSAYIWLKHLLNIERAPFTVKIHNYIMEHLGKKITTEMICNHFKVSKTMVFQGIKNNYGLSLMQYVRKVRVDQAKKYLKEGQIPIHQIAELVGYSDYNYFSRDFKKVENKTPREYRKSIP